MGVALEVIRTCEVVGMVSEVAVVSEVGARDGSDTVAKVPNKVNKHYVM
jgi:hypothetical protein